MAFLAGLAGLFAKVGSFFVSFMNALLKWAAVIGAYFLGKRRAERDMLEDVAEAKDEQLEILSKPDLHRDTLLKRMFRRKRNE